MQEFKISESTADDTLTHGLSGPEVHRHSIAELLRTGKALEKLHFFAQACAKGEISSGQLWIIYEDMDRNSHYCYNIRDKVLQGQTPGIPAAYPAPYPLTIP